MRFALRLSGALPLAASLILAAAPAAAELYKWTDAEGKVHFSDQPPPPEIKAPVTVKPRRPAVAAEKQRNCARAKAQLASLQTGRITRPNAAGEREFLSDAEIAQEVARMQKVADESCN